MKRDPKLPELKAEGEVLVVVVEVEVASAENAAVDSKIKTHVQEPAEELPC
jgi:hypothetical protein